MIQLIFRMIKIHVATAFVKTKKKRKTMKHLRVVAIILLFMGIRCEIRLNYQSARERLNMDLFSSFILRSIILHTWGFGNLTSQLNKFVIIAHHWQIGWGSTKITMNWICFTKMYMNVEVIILLLKRTKCYKTCRRFARLRWPAHKLRKLASLS